MKKHILFICILGIFFISPVWAQGFDVTLEWDANSESDLAGYKIHKGTSSRNYTEVFIPTGEDALKTMYSLNIAVPTDTKITYYFAVTAYDESGLESLYSNEVFQEFDTRTPPAAPKNLRWYKKIIAWIKTHWKFWS